MFGICGHRWIETERFTAPPQAVLESKSTQEALERLVWGITTIILTCKDCGDMKSLEVKGNK